MTQAVRIKASRLMARTNWTVNVKVTGVRFMIMRMRLAKVLIWLAAKVAGVGQLTFKEVE